MSSAISSASLFSTSGTSSSSSSSSSSTSLGSLNLSATDFLTLFVTELQNQDFNDPMDNSEMMSQITQLSNMQMMQEMASYSKSNYAMSLIGKTVTATRTDDGEAETTTGTVSKIVLDDDEYVMYIDGKKYTLDEITQVQSGSDDGSNLDLSSMSVSATNVSSDSATVQWSEPTEDETEASKLKYTVYYSTTGPFDTVSDVVANGTQFGKGDQNELLGATITGLDSGQTYYINVVVEDSDGNEYVYNPALIVTNK